LQHSGTLVPRVPENWCKSSNLSCFYPTGYPGILGVSENVAVTRTLFSGECDV